MEKIPVYIINLKKRLDRKAHILKQFDGREEFEPVLFEAIESENGALGLWLSITKLIAEGDLYLDECIVICEDDHLFTEDYSFEILQKTIKSVSDKKGDVLFAGISWLTNAVPVAENLYWVEKSSGTQFMIIYKRFFNTILAANFTENDAADTKISILSDKKYFMFPYCSVQGEFGYSDVTPKNSVIGRVENLFAESQRKVSVIKYLYDYFYGRKVCLLKSNFKKLDIVLFKKFANKDFDNISTFDGNSFELHYRNTTSKTLFSWSNLKVAVEIAIQKKSDKIVICYDNIKLTKYFSHEFLFKIISNAQELSADLLIGGAEDFEIGIPVTKNLYWINHFINTPLIVIYSSTFEKIISFKSENLISEEFDLSALFTTKFIIYPYIAEIEQTIKDLSLEISLSRMSHKLSSERLKLIGQISTPIKLANIIRK